MTPQRPLRILLISRRYPPQIGGAERVMANLAEALARQGHQVTLLASASGPDGIEASNNLAEASPTANPKVIRLKYSGRRVIGTFGYMWRIQGWIKTHRPDVVYVSMLKQDALAAAWACHRCGIPLLLRPEGAGHTGDMAWQKRHWMGRLVRRACWRADAIVALSPTIRLELLAEGYKASQIHEIANGVAVPEKAWVPPGLSNPTGLFVGRLAQEKG
ncbi:MAG: glycosyltransferase family 4 protein, partial [bacterium]